MSCLVSGIPHGLAIDRQRIVLQPPGPIPGVERLIQRTRFDAHQAIANDEFAGHDIVSILAPAAEALARRHKDALVLEGIAGWMCERAENERQGVTVKLAQAVFSSIEAPLGRRADELKNRRRKRRESADAVVLATMHGAKGLEWDRVWIVACEEKVIPDEKSALEEERRLLYVALTRGKDEVVISASARAPVSRFVREAGLQRKHPEARAA